MVTRVLVNDPADDVGVCLEAVAAGDELRLGEGGLLIARQPIPAGHKIALTSIAAGAPVHKYGQPIGIATSAIEPGEHVHVHNLASGRIGTPR